MVVMLIQIHGIYMCASNLHALCTILKFWQDMLHVSKSAIILLLPCTRAEPPPDDPGQQAGLVTEVQSIFFYNKEELLVQSNTLLAKFFCIIRIVWASKSFWLCYYHVLCKAQTVWGNFTFELNGNNLLLRTSSIHILLPYIKWIQC